MSSKGFAHFGSHGGYGRLLADISGLLEQARRSAVRSVNAVLTATYWQIGRRIVEHEQHGTVRAEYGGTLMQQLARDLTAKHGRGFSIQGLYKMRGFYLGWEILPTPSGEFEAKAKLPTVSGESTSAKVQAPSREQPIVRTLSARSHLLTGGVFPLSWSHYIRLLAVIDLKIGKFTHADAGQMNLYLNYTREHMMEPGENDPAGLILCSAKNDAVVHYAMGGINAKVFASHYLTALPDPETLRREIVTTQRAIEARRRPEET